MNQKELEKMIREFLEGKENQEGRVLFDKQFEEALQEAKNGTVSDEQALREKIHAKLIQRINEERTQKEITLNSRRNWTTIKQAPWRVAAAVALLVSMSLIWYFYGDTFQKATSPTIETMSTAPGQRGTIVTLADGSAIALNAGSTLTYPEHFNQNIREVYLEGEAFFDIARDTLRPFILHVGEVDVKVLGTSFNVQAYSVEKAVAVTVVSGKVQVTPLEGGEKVEERRVLLAPDQQALYNKVNEHLMVKEVKTENAIAWKEGVLIFDQQPLEVVARSLERWYGISISITDEELKQERITFKQKGENLNNVLEALAYIADIQYRIEGQKVILSQPK